MAELGWENGQFLIPGQSGQPIAAAGVDDPGLTGKEPSLGNPSVNNQSLQSTTSGTRSWGLSAGILAGNIQTYGFLNQTETTIAFDGTSVFTLADAGAGWSYYRAGVLHTITGNKTVDLTTVDVTLVDGKTYFIYIDSGTGALIASGTAWTLLDTKVPVCTIVWDNTLTPKYWMGDERHSCLFPRRVHWYEHFTTGTKLITNGALTGFTLNSDTNANKTFAIATSTIADEDFIQVLSALTQPNGTNSDYVVFYRTGASTWAWKASNMPFAYNVGNSNDRIQWDNAGTMTDSTGGGGPNTRWVNSYLLKTNFSGAARYAIIPGQAIFTSLATAQAENPVSFTLTGCPIAEYAIAFRLTWTTVTSTSQGKCRLAANPAALAISAVTVASGAVATIPDYNLVQLAEVAALRFLSGN